MQDQVSCYIANILARGSRRPPGNLFTSGGVVAIRLPNGNPDRFFSSNGIPWIMEVMCENAKTLLLAMKEPIELPFLKLKSFKGLNEEPHYRLTRHVADALHGGTPAAASQIDTFLGWHSMFSVMALPVAYLVVGNILNAQPLASFLGEIVEDHYDILHFAAHILTSLTNPFPVAGPFDVLGFTPRCQSDTIASRLGQRIDAPPDPLHLLFLQRSDTPLLSAQSPGHAANYRVVLPQPQESLYEEPTSDRHVVPAGMDEGLHELVGGGLLIPAAPAQALGVHPMQATLAHAPVPPTGPAGVVTAPRSQAAHPTSAVDRRKQHRPFLRPPQRAPTRYSERLLAAAKNRAIP